MRQPEKSSSERPIEIDELEINKETLEVLDDTDAQGVQGGALTGVPRVCPGYSVTCAAGCTIKAGEPDGLAGA